MYAQNRMANEAREQLRLAIEQVGSGDALRQCFFEEFETARLESILAGENIGTRDPRLPALTTPDRCLAMAVELPEREARQ